MNKNWNCLSLGFLKLMLRIGKTTLTIINTPFLHHKFNGSGELYGPLTRRNVLSFFNSLLEPAKSHLMVSKNLRVWMVLHASTYIVIMVTRIDYQAHIHASIVSSSFIFLDTNSNFIQNLTCPSTRVMKLYVNDFTQQWQQAVITLDLLNCFYYLRKQHITWRREFLKLLREISTIR